MIGPDPNVKAERRGFAYVILCLIKKTEDTFTIEREIEL